MRYSKIYNVIVEQVDRLKELPWIKHKLKRGYQIFLIGSLAKIVLGIDGFRTDSFKKGSSDIDIWVIPPIGEGSLTYDETRKIKEALGNTINGHNIHVFSPWGFLLMMDWRKRGREIARVRLA